MTEPELKDFIMAIMDEREKLSTTKIDALTQRVQDWKQETERAVVLAKQEAVSSAEKLEEALKTYKANTNEWQATFREFKSDNLSRSESLATFKELRSLIEAVDTRVSTLQNQISRGEGGSMALSSARTQANWLIGLVVMAGLNLIGIVATLAYFVTKR